MSLIARAFGPRPAAKATPAGGDGWTTIAQSGAGSGPPGAPTPLATAFSIIKFLAMRLGSFDRRVYARGDRTKAPLRLPEYRWLWGGPAAAAPGVPFWTAVFAHLEGWGEAFIWRSQTAAGRVEGLKLIHPSQLEVLAGDDGEPIYRMRTTRVEYSRREIVHVYGLSFDGVRGIPPVQASAIAHDIADLQERWQRSFLRRGSAPSGVITTPDEFAEGFLKDFYARWNEQHAGPEGVGGVIMMQGEARFQPITVSPVEAQLLQARQFSREEILGVYAPGIPHHLLGWRSNTSNFGTGIDAQNRHLLTHVFGPRLAVVRDAVETALLPDDLSFGWDTASMQVADPKGQADVRAKMRSFGVLTRDEWRAQEGLAPLDIADDVLTPTNTVPTPLGGGAAAVMPPRKPREGAAGQD